MTKEKSNILKTTKNTTLQPPSGKQLFSYYIISKEPLEWLLLPPNIQRLEMYKAEWQIKCMRHDNIDCVIIITHHKIEAKQFLRTISMTLRNVVDWYPIDIGNLHGWIGTWHTQEELKAKIQQITNDLANVNIKQLTKKGE